ncbi:MAG: ABC transporter [Anaerolineales bacterium]|nr:ABC transporter permease [Anaerolineae bacterium]PWB53799.1 MAG: ABC transporter [Anaerolineales bacterium]
MNKIKIIIRKEWAEVFKKRMVLFSVIFLPLFLSVLPLIILYSMGGAASNAAGADLPAQFAKLCKEGMTTGQCMQYYIVSEFMIMFMMIPLFVPVNIAAYSIVGEKTTRSLEPLLATPITTGELLAGKNLASVIPAVIATWVGFAIFAVGSLIITGGGALAAAMLDPMWLIAVLVAGPLMAVLSVNFSIMVSSRVNDPRVAEQLSAVVILPLLAIFFGQIAGLFVLNSALILVMCVILFLVDILMVYLAVRLFQRETILTRWK